LATVANEVILTERQEIQPLDPDVGQVLVLEMGRDRASPNRHSR
jgi:hypothetical protein